MKNLWMAIAVAGGGAAGALARWGLSVGVQRLSGGAAFPWGTLTVNVVGCFTAGLCFVWLVEQGTNPVVRMGVLIGFLGAMTTFSTFSVETLNLAAERRYGPAAANILLSVVIGLAAAGAGMAVARKLSGMT